MIRRGISLLMVLFVTAGILPAYSYAASVDASLREVAITGGTVVEDPFDPLFSQYYADVANEVSEIAVTPTSQNGGASIQVNGAGVVSGSASAAIALDVGVNTITILVTAEDNQTRKTHTLTVTRAGPPGSDAKLSFLGVYTEDKRPFATGFHSSLPNFDIGTSDSISKLLIRPQTSDSAAAVTINGAPALNNKDNPVDLHLGANAIAITVTAPDGTTRTYTVKILRLATSDDNLLAVSVSGDPAMRNPDDITNFLANVTSGVDSVTVMPKPNAKLATVKVNGTTVPGGGASEPIALSFGSNTVSIAVTSEDGAWTGNYTLTITRILPRVFLYLQDGGEYETLADIVPGSKIAEPVKTREGYALLGWYTDPAYTERWDFAADTVDMMDVTLFAKWGRVYTVAFDVQGGSNPIANLIVPEGTIVAPAPPVKAGFAFGGWYAEAGALNPWYFETDIVNADTTLYAKWTAGASYTVLFDSAGGSSIAGLTGVGPGEKIRMPVPIRDGYRFAGWYKEPGFATQWDFAGDTVNADLTLYAKWDPVYTVTFDSRGGSYIPPVETTDGKVPASVSRQTGYIFTGWFRDADLTLPIDFRYESVSGSLTVYAGWFAEPGYTVTFDTRGGNNVGSATGLYPGATISKPADPARGWEYVFDGWYKEPTLDTPWNFATDPVNGDMTLYAKWKDSTHTVTFNARGGYFADGYPTQLTDVARGTKVERPPIPVRWDEDEDLVFDGWFKEVSLVTPWDFETDTVKGDTILYAKWTRMYTVEYHLNDGSSEVISIRVAAESKLAKPADPVSEHYTFKGWYEDGFGLWDFDTDTVNGDTVLYAEWEHNTYLVTYDYQDGSAPEADLVGSGDPAYEPPEPEREGHTFGGWYSDASYDTPWDFDADVVTENVTLYAKWVPFTFTITFDSQGGSPVDSQTVPYLRTAAEPPEPTRAGYTFDWWYRDLEFTVFWDPARGIYENFTVYAKWNPVPAGTYTVAFDSLGGSAVASATGVSAGATIVKPADPTRAGYTFDGWYREAGYTTPWSFGTDTVSGNVTLYAKWTEVPPSDNANLSALGLSSGSLSPAFAAGTTGYAASVANGISSLRVTPVTADAFATVKVNGTDVASGAASNPIGLTVGSNTIMVTVTAQDGTTVQTYSLTVQRAAAVTVDPATPIVVTPTTPVTIEVPLGVTDASVSVTPVTVGSNKEATLPLVDVQAATSLGNVSVSIPEGTKITAPAEWDGTIKLPEIQSPDSVSVGGANVGAVLEVGSPSVSLTFDRAVRLLIPNQGGKSAGFQRDGVFTPITGTISADTQAAADSEIAAGGDAKITVGSDLIIWTKHFTLFATYTAITPPTTTPDPAPTGGSGDSGGSAPAGSYTVGASASAEFTLGGVKFSIPAGATDKSIQVTVDKVADIATLPKDASLQSLGDVYEVKKNSDGAFLKPVTLILSFDKSMVDFAKYEAAVYRLDEETNNWIALDNQQVDQASGTVSGTVDQFGKFAVFVSERIQTPGPSGGEVILTDIEGHWAEAAIRDLVRTGAIGGYADQTFKPNRQITRAEFVSILVNALKLTATNRSSFGDTTGHWAEEAIGTAAALGIVSGYADHTFRPNERITREQMAVIVARALELKASTESVSFTDNSAVSGWAMEGIAAAAENGLIDGYEDGTFKAKNNATRAEAAAVILKAMHFAKPIQN